MVLSLLPLETWQPGGHAVPGELLEILGNVAAILAALWFLFLLVRGWREGDRYRAVRVLGPQDLEALRTELVRAESETVGEIVPVVLERSDAHPETRWLAGLFGLLIGTAVLSPWLPWDRPWLLLLCQIGFGALAFLAAARVPGFRRAFLRESRATETAEEQALQEFYRHGLHRTRERTGVLLLVSLFERRVVVLGDEGIDARMKPGDWADTRREILEHVAGGDLRGGLEAGVRRVGKVLARHFPAGERNENEVRDRIVVRVE